jgi:hypothetical protein
VRTCGKRHRDVVSFMSDGGDGEILRCRWCDQLVPWGPANDDRDARHEATAAELAIVASEGLGPLEASIRLPSAWLRAAFRQGYFDEAYCREIVEGRRIVHGWTPLEMRAEYEVGALARAIYDHDRT